jgi:hypothetical protein
MGLKRDESIIPWAKRLSGMKDGRENARRIQGEREK